MKAPKKQLLVTIVAALCFGACATKKPVHVNVTFPDIGVITTIGIGENLVIQGDGIALPVLVIANDQTVGDLTLRKGRYTATAENSELIRFGQVTNDGAVEQAGRKNVLPTGGD